MIGNALVILCIESQVNTCTVIQPLLLTPARELAPLNTPNEDGFLSTYRREEHADFRTRLIFLNVYRQRCNKALNAPISV